MKRSKQTSAGVVRVDDEIWEKIKTDLKRNARARVHVGVLGAYAGRSDDKEEATNAEIGAVHEFGMVGGYMGTKQAQKARKLGGPNARLENRNLPARSWLRMPVLAVLPQYLSRAKPGEWQRVLVAKGILGTLELLGAKALDVIHQAFETGGFGSWAPLKAATIRRKRAKGSAAGPTAILIDTAQLRQSVTAEVVNRP